MKKVFTLIILFICLKLSAIGMPRPDTLKTQSAKPDTLKLLATEKTPDSSKSKIYLNKKDSIKQQVPVLNQNPVVADLSAAHMDSLKQSIALLSAKTLAALNPATQADSNKQVISTQIADTNVSDTAMVPDSLKQLGFPLKSDSSAVTAPEKNPVVEAEPIDNNPPITSLIQLDSLRGSVLAEQRRQAEIRQQILRNEQLKLAEVLKINDLDSLKQQLKANNSDTVRALIYTRIALKYLDYDTIANPKKQLYYQNQALNYTLLAIRQYSIFNDSTSLRMSFDHLTKVYYSQKKYSQAKWFILQSNSLSRAKNDTPNIISSLLTLAAIKSDIKDYELAMRDLDEALQLSISTHKPKTELEILKNYAFLYNKLQNHPKEAMVLKKRDSLLDSMRKSDEALLAKANAQRKTDSLQNKKKVFSSNMRKLYKNASSRKIASL